MRIVFVSLVVTMGLASAAACGGAGRRNTFDDEDASAGTSSGIVPPNSDSGPGLNDDGSVPPGRTGDPKTCAQAAAAASYVGCDYWPTVTANPVASIFDFAVVVSNVGEEAANVTVTGPGNTNQSATVAPGSLTTLYLPWVDALKGTNPSTGAPATLQASVIARASAFHLVSDRPVVVYQFNPLEYKDEGGPPGKDWSECVPSINTGKCYSYTNDASILLPSTAMTGTYRVLGSAGFTKNAGLGPYGPVAGAYITVTATQDGTEVSIDLGDRADVVAGDGITATAPNNTLTFTLDAGDVAEVLTKKGKDYDMSGSLLVASKPVQVIAGVPCLFVPDDKQACDHVEETVFPAETLGRDYLVTRPSGPRNGVVDHVVRLAGNVDGTTLSYRPEKPSGCPDTLSAGQVVDCGRVNKDFQVTGDHEFGVTTLSLAGEIVDPSGGETPLGDPSLSLPVSTEQYRSRYVFLAPVDYLSNFVNIVAPADTTLTLDGADRSSELAPLDGTDYFVARIELEGNNSGGHTLEASKPVGLQVLGYGENTTYQYPGGLNLEMIAPPPPR